MMTPLISYHRFYFPTSIRHGTMGCVCAGVWAYATRGYCSRLVEEWEHARRRRAASVCVLVLAFAIGTMAQTPSEITLFETSQSPADVHRAQQRSPRGYWSSKRARLAPIRLVVVGSTPKASIMQIAGGSPPTSLKHRYADKNAVASAPSATPEVLRPNQLEELGRNCLLRHEWRRADDLFAKAIQGGAGPESHLWRAQALIAESKPDEARAEMTTFLGTRAPKDLPLTLRMTWLQMDARLELLSSARG